jgi:hypothetical protein
VRFEQKLGNELDISVADPDPVTIFLVKSSIILSNWPKFFSSALSKIKSFKFCEIGGSKKGMTTNFFPPLSFIAAFGSGIRDG